MNPIKILLVVLIISLLGCNKDEIVVPSLVTDIDGNTYQIINIGNQKWLNKNLKTTNYKDGTPITLVTNANEWANLTSEAYSWYDNDANTYKKDYGALYNWYAVNTGKLCPTGWHVPSVTEWTVLTDYLSGESVAGGKLKDTGLTHWESPNEGATNETQFSALPGGSRVSDAIQKGNFNLIGQNGYWWSSNQSSADNAWFRVMYSFNASVLRYEAEKKHGFSVRCLKD